MAKRKGVRNVIPQKRIFSAPPKRTASPFPEANKAVLSRSRLRIRFTTDLWVMSEKLIDSNAHLACKEIPTFSPLALTFTGVCDQLAKGVTRLVTAGHWICDVKGSL